MSWYVATCEYYLETYHGKEYTHKEQTLIRANSRAQAYEKAVESNSQGRKGYLIDVEVELL